MDYEMQQRIRDLRERERSEAQHKEVTQLLRESTAVSRRSIQLHEKEIVKLKAEIATWEGHYNKLEEKWVKADSARERLAEENAALKAKIAQMRDPHKGEF